MYVLLLRHDSWQDQSAGTSSENLGQVSISRSSGQGQIGKCIYVCPVRGKAIAVN